MKNNQPTRLIRLPKVQQHTGYGKAWIYRLISEGHFPAPTKIGAHTVASVESGIGKWIDAVISSSGPYVAQARGIKISISDFEQCEGYWEIIDDNLLDEIFYVNRVEELGPTEEVIKVIELFNYLFTDDKMDVLEKVRRMNMSAQADIFDLWFDIIRLRDYVEAVAKIVIYYSIGMPV